MNSRSKDIVIVGGGTTGWSAAALLSAFRRYNVVVIEPVDNNPIGVGESTLPVINGFHTATNFPIFSSEEWASEVYATAKFSIEFADFSAKGTVWTHPFLMPHEQSLFEGLSNGMIEGGVGKDQYEFFSENTELGRRRKAGFERLPCYGRSTGYAYHMDAAKYGALLKRESLKRENCTLKAATVTSVIWAGDTVEKLILDDGSEVAADYFIDCTGFKRELTKSSWKSYKDRMWCDRAAAVQLPYVDREKQERNTTYCHALSSGWVWNVPLASRIGTGYVFSSKYLSDEDAVAELRDHLCTTYGYSPDQINPRIVPFESGRVEVAWTGNVVSLGLAQMFIEPIESTAIALTQLALLDLEPLLDADHVAIDTRRSRYNRAVSLRSDATLEFAEAHYVFSRRKDSPFWLAYTTKEKSPVQSALLSLFTGREGILDNGTLAETTGGLTFFGSESWIALFMAYGYSAQDSKPAQKWHEERLSICRKCPHLSGDGLLKKCTLCGCFMELKSRMKSSSCPVGKW